MADKQLIIVVEGTAAVGPYWNTIVSDYLHKIIRSFCAEDTTVQKSSDESDSGPTFELALVVFNTQGPYSAYLVQRSGWTRDVDTFFDWLSALSFSGGGCNDVATAEGLAEALMMFAIPQNGCQEQQDIDGKRHCVLVSASNPYPLPTLVYRPTLENPELSEDGEEKKKLLYDAETVSKWFGQCSVSLSVISPRKIPKLRAMYDAAKKRSQETSETAVYVKQPHFLVLISDCFIEACDALSRPAVLPTDISTLTIPPISTLNAPPTTVKVEPSTMTSLGSGPAHAHMPSMPHPSGPTVSSVKASSSPISENIITNNENLPELKPVTSIGDLQNSVSNPRIPSSGQSTAITGTSQPIQNTASNSFSTAPSNVPTMSNPGTSQPPTNLHGSSNNTVLGDGQRNVQSVAQSGISETPNMTSSEGTNVGPSVTGSNMATVALPQQAQGTQSVGVSGSASAMIMSQQTSTSVPPQSKYVKVWEGNLCAQKYGQSVLITKLEAYRNGAGPDTLAANWPSKLILGRLIPQDYMNNKQYVGKAVFLVFRAMNLHGFLVQLQQKKLCAVVSLPTQTLLLSVSDKACRLIGMVLPGDNVAFNLQIPGQVGQQNQQQHPQLQQQQTSQASQQNQRQHPQLQQQQTSQVSQQNQRQHPQLQQHQQQQRNQVSQQNQQQQNQQPQLQKQQQQQQQTMQMGGGGKSQGHKQPPPLRPQSLSQAQGQVPTRGGSPNMGGGGGLGP